MEQIALLHGEKLVSAIVNKDILKENDKRDYLFFCFAIYTSLRRNEILALKWQDLDFQMLEINVRNKVFFPSGQNAPIVMQLEVDDCGVYHLQYELIKSIEPYQKQSGYIIPYSETLVDKPMTRSTYYGMWNRIRKTLDLQDITFNSFRVWYEVLLGLPSEPIDLNVLL